MNINIGINIFCKQLGKGDPLILLHGNGEDHTIFDKLALKLQTDYTLYLIDSRNHGRSDKTDEYSYESMADDLYEVMRALNISKAGLIGFSDGAIISILFAMKHPHMISKMALLGVNLSPEDMTEEAYNYVKDAYEKTADPLFKMMLEQPNININQLRSINVDSLIIGAENDIYKSETFEKISHALPKSELYIVKGHDHGSYIINEDLLYDKLNSYFNK